MHSLFQSTLTSLSADHSFGTTGTISYPIIQYALDVQASLRFIDYKCNSTFTPNDGASICYKRLALQRSISYKCDLIIMSSIRLLQVSSHMFYILSFPNVITVNCEHCNIDTIDKQVHVHKIGQD